MLPGVKLQLSIKTKQEAVLMPREKKKPQWVACGLWENQWYSKNPSTIRSGACARI